MVLAADRIRGSLQSYFLLVRQSWSQAPAKGDLSVLQPLSNQGCHGSCLSLAQGTERQEAAGAHYMQKEVQIPD